VFFSTSKTVLREAAGTYVNGKWTAGARTTTTTLASIQALGNAQDMNAMPEGRRLSDFVKIYTKDLLNVTVEGTGMQPDIIVHEGYGYEITSIFVNQSGIISHYKYIGSKIFKFTSIADWLSGVIERP
jgi:hypothetical protein